jgi:diguanylate cyclase (GGDEF)-like protein
MMFIYKPLTDFNPYYYAVLIVAFFTASLLGYHIHWKITRSNQVYKVTTEKVHEDTNLIQNHYDARVAEIAAMEEKIESLLKLKNISDELSLTFSTEDVIKVVGEQTFDKFKGDVRVSFYLTDDKNQELNLAFAAKADNRNPVIMKKGGIFERWVMTKMISLLVKDVSKDFRFSIDSEEKEEDFFSLMSKPLISEGKVMGILRVDSKLHEAFGQHELRVLDIIGDLAAVALHNAKLYHRTEELAIKDSLTELYVHRYFMERLEAEVKRALRADGRFAIFMLDIDDFKKFNDRYGHIAGDLILKNVSRILGNRASAGDIVARYGGEEFAMVKLNCGKKEAFELAEDIRKEIQGNFVDIRREKTSVTVSIGVAVFPDDAKLKDDLVWDADKYLYEAKTEGKNRVCAG